MVISLQLNQIPGPQPTHLGIRYLLELPRYTTFQTERIIHSLHQLFTCFTPKTKMYPMDIRAYRGKFKPIE